MPDERRPKGQPDPVGQPSAAADEDRAAETRTDEAPAGAATATDEEAPEGEKPPKKLNQQVEIKDVGPCKKHVKVIIPREDINERLDEKFSELVVEATVPGYRPGKAPRKLIEKKFYPDVAEQLKAELLMQSLEQLAEEHHLNPITQPDLDPFKIEMPKDGPLEYEFEVEVAPEFELPQYRGLRLKRPVREITEAEVEKAERRLLSQYGTLKTKDGPAEVGDYLAASIRISANGREITTLKDITLKVDSQLAFKDGLVRNFADQVAGVRAGEQRTVAIELTPNASDPNLRGRTVQGEIMVKEVKVLELPELTHEFLHHFGVHSPEQLRERVRDALRRQMEYEQRQAARRQVLEHISAAATWELPPDLLQRQARRTLARRVMEMRSAGFPEEEIRNRTTLLQQDALASTARALKEHFVLQKIAEVEKIEVNEEDIDFEIETLAMQSGESPRRVRARLEKEDMLETLATEILERKALDLVLDSAEYEDVPFEEEAAPSAVEEQAVPGEPPPEPAATVTQQEGTAGAAS
jgi:trigger factor